ncbi:MAG: hypothetical protein M3N22_11150, partial [Acidobacteriota bacterium]|nr:hypothetical protein [Acidobacteriota bacterium]
AEELRLEPWWPRWISIDWGFQHPSAVYWHCAIPAQNAGPRDASSGGVYEGNAGNQRSGWRIVTYREFVQNGLSPRMLAQGIAERSGKERISEVFLSPDAFAHRTAEASIAEQLSEVLASNGLPRASAADDDRVGGWQLMYQLLESDAWSITENCARLIECMPLLIRDERRVEDIRKADGDDPADAARYGLVSGGRIAGVGAGLVPPGAALRPPNFNGASGPRFVSGMPLGEQIERQVSATDPTSRAIHFERLQGEANKYFRPKKLRRR